MVCLDDLRGKGVRRSWPAGATVLHEGDDSDYVVIIEIGSVKVSLSSPAGRQVVLAIRGPGDLLGEIAAIDGRARSATVTALSSVTATVLPGAAFRSLLMKDGARSFAMLRMVTERLREADAHRLELSTYAVLHRTSRLLADFAGRHGFVGRDGAAIQVPLSQAELAQATGASREAVVKALRHLRELGAVRTSRRRIEILNLDVLSMITDDLQPGTSPV
ncbi:Crp/Fnr family transcriptional regulator [Amycolatopsis sp. NPDC101161]|uniref:Crp/Fnr family transcriptional regulator n=1 Tax=Amycolatopsis sp. NPDC101161 TaxID=3363940 RepID=UPI00382E32B7